MSPVTIEIPVLVPNRHSLPLEAIGQQFAGRCVILDGEIACPGADAPPLFYELPRRRLYRTPTMG